jgi:hypothetical protein
MPGFSNHYHKHWESWCPHSHAVNSPSFEYEYEWPRSRYQKPSELDEVGKLLMQSSSVYLAGYCQTLACFLYTKYSTWSKVQESQCHSLFCGFTLAILYYPYPNSSTFGTTTFPKQGKSWALNKLMKNGLIFSMTIKSK